MGDHWPICLVFSFSPRFFMNIMKRRFGFGLAVLSAIFACGVSFRCVHLNPCSSLLFCLLPAITCRAQHAPVSDAEGGGAPPPGRQHRCSKLESKSWCRIYDPCAIRREAYDTYDCLSVREGKSIVYEERCCNSAPHGVLLLVHEHGIIRTQQQILFNQSLPCRRKRRI